MIDARLATRTFELPGEESPSCLYCIGSEVGNSMNLTRGDLYKKYPLLWRRQCTVSERRMLIEQKIIASSAPPSVTLVKVDEIIDILDGKGHLYQNSNSNDQKKSKSTNQQIKFMKRIELNAEPHIPVSPLAPLKLKTEQSFRTSNLIDHYDYKQKDEYSKSIPNIIPIKLDLEVGQQRLKDTFFWDKNDTSITPEIFASIECEDFGLKPSDFQDLIIDSIQQQILKSETPDIDENLFYVLCNPILTIKLDIPIGYTRLIDAFEWDVRTIASNAPEEFATKLCNEIGLGGEFINAVVFSIRSQVMQYKKACEQHIMNNANFNTSLYTNTSQSDTNIEENQKNISGPSSLTDNSQYLKVSIDPNVLESILRPESDWNFYCPKLEALNEYELEKKMKTMERSNRRSRRTNFNASMI